MPADPAFRAKKRAAAHFGGSPSEIAAAGPFVVAHHSFPQAGDEKRLWLDRYAAFAVASGIPAEKARNAVEAIADRLPILSPEEDEASLREAGFSDVSLFNAGFTFRGWVAHRS